MGKHFFRVGLVLSDTIKYDNIMLCKNCGYRILMGGLFNKYFDKYHDLNCAPKEK